MKKVRQLIHVRDATNPTDLHELAKDIRDGYRIAFAPTKLSHGDRFLFVLEKEVDE